MFAAAPEPDRLQTLGEISRAVSSTLDVRALYDTIYREVGRVMDATMFSIAIFDKDHGSITLPYIREEGKLLLDETISYGGNLTSLVIDGGTPLLFEGHSEYQEFARARGLPDLNVGEGEGEAVIFVPLHTGDRTIGTMSVESKRRNAYSSDDLETLSIIASQAAIAIENARLFARSQDAIREMQVLLHVARTINQSLDLHDVLDAILASMREVMPYAYAAIMLPNHAERSLEIFGSIGADEKVRTQDRSTRFKIPFGQGISGAVFESGEPLIVPDVLTFAGFVDHELPEVRSEMAVPLRRGTDVVGVLDVGRSGVNAFAAEELNLLSLFASQAAIAIENARLFAEQRQRVEELQTIQSMVRNLMPLHDLTAIAELLTGELNQLIDFHACRIYLMQPETQTLMPMSYTDTGAAPIRLPIDRGFAGWIARHGKPGIIANTLQDDRPTHIPGSQRREESMIGAPLIYEGRVRGVITLSQLGPDGFDENSLRLLEIIAAQVAIAFDRARLYDELRTDAITDPLVRLWNRRYLLERYREERLRSIRNGRPLVAVMLDIDKFKRVNDSYGHDAGDVVLRELAALIRSHMRTEDIVARYGGEEFCTLLPETTLEEAARIAERLRARIESYDMPEAAGVRRITASIGIASWMLADNGEELFSRADLAMYKVKAAGGNGVCISDRDDLRMYSEPV